MEKIIQRIPLVLFTLFSIKLLILQTFSYESALVLLVMASIVALIETNLKINEIKKLYKAMEDQAQEIKLVKEHQERLSTNVASIKMANNIKTSGTALRF